LMWFSEQVDTNKQTAHWMSRSRDPKGERKEAILEAGFQIYDLMMWIVSKGEGNFPWGVTLYLPALWLPSWKRIN
jgi:hypothetical protein